MFAIACGLLDSREQCKCVAAQATAQAILHLAMMAGGNLMQASIGSVALQGENSKSCKGNIHRKLTILEMLSLPDAVGIIFVTLAEQKLR
jgi:hypothetical protein